MSVMSEVHQDLETIHNILLGQRKILRDQHKKIMEQSGLFKDELRFKVDCINDLLLEFEAAGIEWPSNVVELNAQT